MSGCCGGSKSRPKAARQPGNNVVVFEVWGRDGTMRIFATLANAKTLATSNGGLVRSKLVAAGTPTEDSAGT